MLQPTDQNKQDIIKLMGDTMLYRRNLLVGGEFSSPTVIKKILSDYPRLLDFNGLLVIICLTSYIVHSISSNSFLDDLIRMKIYVKCFTLLKVLREFADIHAGVDKFQEKYLEYSVKILDYSKTCFDHDFAQKVLQLHEGDFIIYSVWKKLRKLFFFLNKTFYPLFSVLPFFETSIPY